VNLANHDNST